MFICPDCQQIYRGVAVSESEGPCEVCQNMAVCGDIPRYERRTDREISAAVKRLRRIEVAAADLVEMIRTSGMHENWKPLARALESSEKARHDRKPS